MRHSKNRAMGGVRRVDTKYTQFIAKEELGLLDFVMKKLSGISRTKAKSILTNGGVLVEHQVETRHDFLVKPEMIVEISKHPGGSTRSFDYTPFFDIVYEDDELLVVNKPAGLVVHPGHGNYSGTLVNALAYHFKDNPDYDVSDPRMGLVHRIDKDTSGLLVIAKTPRAKTHLGLQFFNKTTKRQYVAVVWGEMKDTDGTVEGNIGRSLKDRLQMAVFPEGDMGKHAVTHYHTLENLSHVAVVRCQLETGRTHQIRVHMKYIGHPLFNDARYGGDKVLRGNTSAKYMQFIQNCFKICPRQALHAKTLGFVHPVTHQQMDFDSEIPADMTALINKWRDYSNAIDQ